VGVERAAVPPEEAWPSVDDVAALLRARTKDNNGVELGTFNEATRPTGAEVSLIIANAASEVAGELSADVPIVLLGSYEFCVKLLSACLIELSYWPEQVQTERSPYIHYWAMFLRAIQSLQERLPDEAGDGDASLDDLGIGNLGLVRPYGDWRCCRLGSPPDHPELVCASVNYNPPWC
jgi:hypothetical protein